MFKRRLMGLVHMLDGTISASLGHEFMRFLMDILPSPISKIPAFFLKVPEPIFRIGAVLQVILGWEMLHSK
jgi:hypothetical protein